jgi:hypothetical protein
MIYDRTWGTYERALGSGDKICGVGILFDISRIIICANTRSS